MGNRLINIGVLIVLLAVIMMVVFDLQLGIEQPSFVQWILAGGVIFFGLGVVLRMIEKGSHAVKSSKCVRCGEKIPSGHIYCTKHDIEAINEIKSNAKK